MNHVIISCTNCSKHYATISSKIDIFITTEVLYWRAQKLSPNMSSQKAEASTELIVIEIKHTIRNTKRHC